MNRRAMCPCPEPLINEWLDGSGRVVEVRILTFDAPLTDAADFNAHPTAVGWRILCQGCRRVYATAIMIN